MALTTKEAIRARHTLTPMARAATSSSREARSASPSFEDWKM